MYAMELGEEILVSDDVVKKIKNSNLKEQIKKAELEIQFLKKKLEERSDSDQSNLIDQLIRENNRLKNQEKNHDFIVKDLNNTIEKLNNQIRELERNIRLKTHSEKRKPLFDQDDYHQGDYDELWWK